MFIYLMFLLFIYVYISNVSVIFFYNLPRMDKVGYSLCTHNAVQQMFYESLSVEVILV